MQIYSLLAKPLLEVVVAPSEVAIGEKGLVVPVAPRVTAMSVVVVVVVPVAPCETAMSVVVAVVVALCETAMGVVVVVAALCEIAFDQKGLATEVAAVPVAPCETAIGVKGPAVAREGRAVELMALILVVSYLGPGANHYCLYGPLVTRIRPSHFPHSWLHAFLNLKGLSFLPRSR